MKNVLKKFGGAGVTLTELMLVSAIIGILAIPLTRMLKGGLGAFMAAESRTTRQQSATTGRGAVAWDMKDINEVLFGSPTRVVFVMDSYRWQDVRPDKYNYFADDDGDAVQNISDPDRDGDALVGNTDMRSLMNRPGKVVGTVGWRQGLDLEDDDEDNDGRRDLTVSYTYLPDRQVVEREVFVNEESVQKSTLWDHVVSSTFTYFARPDTLGVPPNADTGGDGIVDTAELAALGNGGDLDRFAETRWISGWEYAITILTEGSAVPYVEKRRDFYPLMESKEKFP